MDRRIKFRHIQSFVEIAKFQSLKQAAEKLFLTQPAISKTLKELEEIVGAPLMVRNRAGVALTPQGEVFLHFAQMSLVSLQQGFDGIKQVGRDGEERLFVGSLPSVAASLLPKTVADFSRLAPSAVLHTVEGPHGFLIEKLRNGDLDLVLGRLGEPDTMQGLTFTQIYTEQIAIVVRAGHPLADAQDLSLINNYQVLFPPSGSVIRPLVEKLFIAHGVGAISNRIETVSGAFGRVYTRMTDAVWIISSGVVSNETADGALVCLPVDTSITRGPVGVMARPDLVESTALQVFRTAILKVAESIITGT